MYLSRFVMFPGGYICSHFYLVDVQVFVITPVCQAVDKLNDDGL